MKISCNIDDFCPMTTPYDFGGVGGKVLSRLEKLHSRFDMKFTMFTVANWTDLPHTTDMLALRKAGLNFEFENNPFLLTKHPNWCKKIRKMIDKEIIEIAMHGLTHHNTKAEGGHNQEFISLSYSEALQNISTAEYILNECNIPFIKMFRPPGFGFNKNTLYALISRSYNSIAPFPSWYNNSKFKMGKLKVPPNSFYNLKFHTCSNFGNEKIENGLEDDTVYKSLIKKLEKMDIEPIFYSERIS